MSAFEIRYQQQPADEMYPEKAKAKSHVKSRVLKLVLSITIAAIGMLSFAGNIISYTHWRDLQQKQDMHLLQYDSLLSAKLLTDQELARLKASLQTSPAEGKLLPILTQKAASLPEENRAPNRK